MATTGDDLEPVSPAERGLQGRAKLAVAAAGVGSAAAQVLVIRELLVASAGNELSIAAVLASWLLWSAVGAWLGGRCAGSDRRSAVSHVCVVAVVELFVLGAALAISRGGLYGLREVLGGTLIRWGVVPLAGGTLSLPQLIVLTSLVTAPAGVLLGWQFAAGCALLQRTGAPGKRGPALAYVADSVGHLIGGAALSIAAVIRIPAEWTLLCACALVMLAVWLLRPVVWRLVLGVVVVVALAVAAPTFRELTLGLRWAPHRVTASKDGPLGNVALVHGEGDELAFFANGAHAFETGRVLAGEQWVDIPLLAHENPRRILLIGGGPRAVRQALAHYPDRIVYFELDPTIIRAVREYTPPGFSRVLDDPRVAVSLGDARLHLTALRRSGERFDVALVALGDPTTAQLNRYYTVEWFRQVQRILAPDGLIAFQVTSSGDYLSDELRSYDACVFHTVREAGLRVTVFPGPHMTMLAARREGAASVFDDAIALDARMESRDMDVSTVLASFYDALDPARRDDRQRELEQTTDVRINRDFSPTCYYYAQVLWASWWRGRTAAILSWAQRLTVLHVLLAIGVLTVLAGMIARVGKTPSRVVAPYALFVAGAGGMTLEVVLLLGLQSLYGYVYGIVGYALGVLMGGLALGAWAAQRRAGGERPHLWLAATQIGIVISAALAVAGLLLLKQTVHLWTSAGLLPVVVIWLLMGVTGLAVGAAFPMALATVRDDNVRRATALYATDLVGACGGALLSGLILIPLLGIVATCGVVAALAAGSALLCVLSPMKGEAV